MTYSLRIAEAKDVNTVLSLCYELFQSSVYAKLGVFDVNHVKETFLVMQEARLEDMCTLLLYKGEAPVGVLCTAAHEGSFSSDRIATELAFYIIPSERNYKSIRTLQQAYYYWARAVSCKYLTQGKIKDDKNIETYSFRKLRTQ